VCVSVCVCVCVCERERERAREREREREMAIDWTADRETVIRLLAGGENFLFSKVSRPTFKAHTDPIQWVSRLFPRWQYSSLG